MYNKSLWEIYTLQISSTDRLLLLGSLSTCLRLLLLHYGLDDSYSHRLTHVSDSETAKRSVVYEGLHHHGLGGLQSHNASIAVLHELGVGFHHLTSSAVKLLIDILELSGDVAGVAIQHRSISVLDLAGVGHDDHLGSELLAALSGIVSGVGGNVASLQVLHGNILAVKANVVTRDSLHKSLVVHLDGLDFSSEADGSEGNHHVGLEDSSLHTADWHSANTTDLVHVLKGQAKGLVSRALGRVHQVEGLQKDGALVPGHIGGAFDHVVTNPARDGHEVDLGGLVSNLLQVT
mmetsp:Transcript_5309/g.5810  ORF Transcript_5309/g.5810 Transcript_5309/m.5810 type:complete len:291 (+) Transcript_5309:321-1193(+)